MKKSLIKVYAAAASVALLAGLGACSITFTPNSPSSSSAVRAPKGWKKFTSTELGYSIYFPGTPERDTYKDNGGSYIRYSTLGDGEDINYSVSFTGFSSSQKADAEKFNEAQKKKVLTNFAKLIGLEESDITFTTVDGYLAFTYVSHATENSSLVLRRAVMGWNLLACLRPRPILSGILSVYCRILTRTAGITRCEKVECLCVSLFRWDIQRIYNLYYKLFCGGSYGLHGFLLF